MPSGIYPRTPVQERFDSKIFKSGNGCWIWLGNKNYKGYGLFSNGGHLVSAHRFAYENAKGKIPDGFILDHLCRNRSCVNPEHLEIVTNQENCQRGNTGQQNANKTHCPKGHPYTVKNTYIYHMKDGRALRSCRICHANREITRRKLLCAQ